MNVKGHKWSEYKKMRARVTGTLSSEYNRAIHEAIFPQDIERAAKLKEALDFINAFNSNMYHFTCPLCGSRLFTHAVVNDIDFNNEKYEYFPQYNTKEHYDTLHISRCKKCGWYTIEEF